MKGCVRHTPDFISREALPWHSPGNDSCTRLLPRIGVRGRLCFAHRNDRGRTGFTLKGTIARFRGNDKAGISVVTHFKPKK